MSRRSNWVDRTGRLWPMSGQLESFQLRKLGTSPMALLNPGQVLVIETTGRRPGRQRFTPVGYWQEPDGAYVLGGGAASQTRTPDWVANLRASPQAALWIGRRRIPVLAHELTDDERDAAQQKAARIWPGIDRYQKRSGRVIPSFRLVPRA